MKKIIAFLILCIMCIVFTVSSSSKAYAHEEIPTYYSAGGDGGSGGIWVEICKFIGQACINGGVCVIMEQVLLCILDDPDDPSNQTKMTICQCMNEESCFQKCGCGFESAGTGPTGTGTHRCGVQQQ